MSNGDIFAYKSEDNHCKRKSFNRVAAFTSQNHVTKYFRKTKEHDANWTEAINSLVFQVA